MVRKGLTHISEPTLRTLLKLPDTLQVGTAIDDGGCFFDALAQALNAIHSTQQHTERSLRLLCHQLHSQSQYKPLIDELNRKDYGGIDRGDDYYFVQYPAAELEKYFNGRLPICGRIHIEGRLLCIALKERLPAIHVIKLLNDPETQQLIAAHHVVTREGSKAVNVCECPSYTANVPVLVVFGQQDLHYVPILPKEQRLEFSYLTNTQINSLLSSQATMARPSVSISPKRVRPSSASSPLQSSSFSSLVQSPASQSPLLFTSAAQRTTTQLPFVSPTSSLLEQWLTLARHYAKTIFL